MEDSGLQPGDVVYSLDGHRIYNYNNLTFFLGRAGDTLDFVEMCIRDRAPIWGPGRSAYCLLSRFPAVPEIPSNPVER